jgi:hypothetical protein
MYNLNDNVFRNLGNTKMSPRTYDPAFKYTKKSLSDTEVEKEVSKFLQEKTEEQRDKALELSIDKIMIAHRNTKLLLFLMSGPFLIMFTLVKYVFKILILYLLY